MPPPHLELCWSIGRTDTNADRVNHGEGITRLIEENKDVMTHIEGLITLLSGLDIRVDDPAFIAVAQNFQRQNQSWSICFCMNLLGIGLSVAIVAYTEINERIENEQENEVKKQTTYVFCSQFGSGNEIPPVLFHVKTHFPTKTEKCSPCVLSLLSHKIFQW